MLAGLAAVAGTGLLAGILIAAPRISPLAAGLPGLLLLGLTALYLVNVRHAVHLIPLKSHPYGAGFEAMLVHGILAAAGLAMIIPMFVPSRWRARRIPEPEVIGDAEYIPGFGAITEPLLRADPASYPEPGAQSGPAGPLPGVQHEALPSGLPRRLPRLPRGCRADRLPRAPAAGMDASGPALLACQSGLEAGLPATKAAMRSSMSSRPVPNSPSQRSSASPAARRYTVGKRRRSISSAGSISSRGLSASWTASRCSGERAGLSPPGTGLAAACPAVPRPSSGLVSALVKAPSPGWGPAAPWRWFPAAGSPAGNC